MLLALVGILLLLACVNVSGILLAQAASRSERWLCAPALVPAAAVTIRQVLTESCLLSIDRSADWDIRCVFRDWNPPEDPRQRARTRTCTPVGSC